MNFTLKQLCYFDAALRNGSIARAAVEMNISQSSITAAIDMIEQCVGAELFRRVQLAAREDLQALGELDQAAGFDADAWGEALDGYFGEYDRILTDGDARSQALVTKDELARLWPRV